MTVLLFSGGLDSTCIAAIERPDLLLTIDYGQVQAPGENAASQQIASHLGLKHKVIVARPEKCGRGLMAGQPKSSSQYPAEWWPFRNQFLLTVAAMHLENGTECDLLIGTVSSDARQSDGHPRFLDTFNDLLRSQSSLVSVRAPAINLTSETLFEKAQLESEVSGWIFSCHVSEFACGECSGCAKSAEILGHSRPSNSS